MAAAGTEGQLVCDAGAARVVSGANRFLNPVVAGVVEGSSSRCRRKIVAAGVAVCSWEPCFLEVANSSWSSSSSSSSK